MEVTSDPGALITTFTGATSAYFQVEGGAPTEPSYTTANDAGTLVIGGNPVCPFNGSGAEEMELNNSQIRPVISGTGDFIGALGGVKTTRNEDLTYRHEFQLVGITQGTQLSVVSQTK